MAKTAKDEAEELVDGVVNDKRQQIKKDKENLIQKTVEELETFREMNVVFSEVRRRMEKQ
jgi:hypothetical protein